MAFNTKLYSMMFIVIFFLVVVEESSGCHTGQRCFYAKEAFLGEIQSRKVLIVYKGGHQRSSTSTGNSDQKLIVRELRTVPSGPDPLHHNGGTPKKPRTP